MSVVTVFALAWTLAASSAAAVQEQGFPPLRLPGLSWLTSWLKDPHWGMLPHQDSGSAAGHSHAASTASTRAPGGAGHAPGKGAGQLPPYAPLARLTKSGPSTSAVRGFSARTSTRVPAKSTATSDYYRNADGSFTRKLSENVVNYRDAAGNWQPIDKALISAASGRWAEKANSLSVSFAGSAADPALASVGFGPGESLSYGLSGAAAARPSVSGSTITYANVSRATDVVLSPTAAGLKESLILHSAAAGGSWTFPLTLTGLTARQATDGSIGLFDKSGKQAATIPHAYAYDSKVDPATGSPAGTHALTYRLQTAAGRQQLVVTLDSAWLNDPARVFPVTVDPTVGGAGEAVTTYVEAPTAADHSMEPTIKIGSPDAGAHKDAAFVAFPSSGLDGSQNTVSAATLTLFDTFATNCSGYGFGVAPVTQAWTASQLTTYPGPSIGAQIGSSSPSTPNACANSGGDLSKGDYVNVTLSTAAFTGWASNPASDFGLALYASTTDSAHYKVFDSDNTEWGPTLSLTYSGYLLPVISSQFPNNGAGEPTLTPTLAATGNEDGNLGANPNNPGVKFDFQVVDASGNKVVDSGLIRPTNYAVPAGKLAWNKSYYWTVQAYDGTNYSINPVWNSFTTTVPQPVLTSSLSQNTGGHGFDGAIGNYTTSATDAHVATVGPSLDVVRDYNSRDPRTTGAFGAAWSSIFDARATEKHDASGALQTVVVTYPDGSEVGYGKNNDGSFSPPLGRFATFKSVTGGYTLTDKIHLHSVARHRRVRHHGGDRRTRARGEFRLALRPAQHHDFRVGPSPASDLEHAHRRDAPSHHRGGDRPGHRRAAAHGADVDVQLHRRPAQFRLPARHHDGVYRLHVQRRFALPDAGARRRRLVPLADG